MGDVDRLEILKEVSKDDFIDDTGHQEQQDVKDVKDQKDVKDVKDTKDV